MSPALSNPSVDLWTFRVLWLILPFTAGPVFRAALADTGRSFEVTVGIGLWVLWGAVLIISMVPRTQTLTVMRIVTPAAFAATLWAVFAGGDAIDPSWTISTALATSGLAAAIALRAPFGDAFVDGSSYGDETRFLLRTPGALLIGPIQVVWAVVVVGAAAGPLLLAAKSWIAGGIALVVGWALAYGAVPILHRLSNRWLVFVPAGVVVHDKTALREPQLFRKETIAAFGPAPTSTEFEDLSLDGLGLALRAELTEDSKIIKNSRDEEVALTDVSGWIVSPNRPGAVVAEAKSRGFPIA